MRFGICFRITGRSTCMWYMGARILVSRRARMHFPIWKEKWQHPDTADIMNEVRYLLSHHRSFNLYVVHGGTNFGFTSGANAFSDLEREVAASGYGGYYE